MDRLTSSITNINRKNPVYTWYLESQLPYSHENMIVVFLMINKYFKKIELVSFDEDYSWTSSNWEDLIITNKIELKNYPVECLMHISFFAQEGELVDRVLISNGLRFFYSGSKEGFNLNFDFYTNVFTDINFNCIENNVIELDQGKAAKRNRAILHNFCSEMRDLFHPCRVNFSSDYIENRYLTDSGIIDEAILQHK